MRTDDKCFRPFIELRALALRSINDHGNSQFNPLAPSVFRPSFCAGGFLFVHTTMISRFGHKREVAFPDQHILLTQSALCSAWKATAGSA